MSEMQTDSDARADDGLRRALTPASDLGGDPGEGGNETPPQEVPDDGDHAPEEQPMEADEHVDKQLDKGLKETFPASDPVSINPGAD